MGFIIVRVTALTSWWHTTWTHIDWILRIVPVSLHNTLQHPEPITALQLLSSECVKNPGKREGKVWILLDYMPAVVGNEDRCLNFDCTNMSPKLHRGGEQWVPLTWQVPLLFDTEEEMVWLTKSSFECTAFDKQKGKFVYVLLKQAHKKGNLKMIYFSTFRHSNTRNWDSSQGTSVTKALEIYVRSITDNFYWWN